MRVIFLVISFYLLFFSQTALAFDNKETHPHLTESAIEKAELDNFLKDNLGLEEGINTVAKKKNKIFFEKKSINDWLQSGTELEDKPMCRASNHFHDPLVADWTESGLTDTKLSTNLWCYGLGLGQYPPDEISSNLTWANGHMSPSEKEDTGVGEFNEWDWDSAREYYYIYLTGKDF